MIEEIHYTDSICILCHEAICSANEAILITPPAPDIRVVECPKICLRCTRPPRNLLWCHSECQAILNLSYQTETPPTLEDLRNFGHLTSSQFDDVDHPAAGMAEMATSEGLLSPHTKRILERSFSQALLRRLPPELYQMIIENIGTCSYLIVLGESRRLIDMVRRQVYSIGDVQTRFLVTSPIFASKLNFRNKSYFSQISNDNSVIPLAERVCHQVDAQRVIVSLDDVGVTNIQVLDGLSPINSSGSSWYQVFKVRNSAERFTAISNGLILRRLLPESYPDSFSKVLWDTPNPPELKRENFISVDYTPRTRFRYVSFHEKMTGLTVYCRARKFMGIHVHVRGDLSTCPLPRGIKSAFHVYRVYFPINTGEKIQNVWVRTKKLLQGAALDPTLVIQTTHSRIRTFGTHIDPEHEDYFDFHSLVQESDGLVSGLYHNALDSKRDSALEIGVSCKPLPTIRRSGTDFKYPRPPPALDHPRSGSPSQTWYLSAASLDNLQYVRFCYNENQASLPCVGMLLCYKDGSQEALGQVRCDFSITEDIALRSARFRNLKIDGRYFIHFCSTTPPVQDEGKTVWCSFPERGVIAWWFSSLGNHINVDQFQTDANLVRG